MARHGRAWVPAVLAFTFVALILVPGLRVQAQATPLLETFEDFTFPNDPSSPYYTFSKTGGGSASIFTDNPASDSGTKSLNIKYSSAQVIGRFTVTANLCDGRIVDFWMKSVNKGSNGGSVGLMSGSTGVRLAWNPAGPVIQLQYFNPVASNIASVTITPVANGHVAGTPTWQHFGLACTSTLGCLYNFDTSEDQCTAAVTSSPFTVNTVDLVANTGAEWRIDNIAFGNAAAAAQAVNLEAASDQPAGQFLLGFDVDPFKNAVVARTLDDARSHIRVYDPITLAEVGASPVANGCMVYGGLMSYYEDLAGTSYIGYTDCWPDNPFSVNAFRIRSPLLGDPKLPNVCTTHPEDWCSFDLQTADQGQSCPGSSTKTLRGGTGQIGLVRSIPISWSNARDEQGALEPNDNAMLGFAYSDRGNGRVGVWAIVQHHNDDSETCGYDVPFASTPEGTTDLCGWRATDGHDYLAAIGTNVLPKVWRIDITRDQGYPIVTYQPNIQMTLVYTAQDAYTSQGTTVSGFSNTNSVACTGRELILQSTSGNLARINVVGTEVGKVHWVKTGVIATSAGAVSISDNGLYFTYQKTATQVVVATVANATDLIMVTKPSGDLFAARLSDAAKDLYLATQSASIAADNRIALYHLTETGLVGDEPDGVRCVDNNDAPVPCNQPGSIRKCIRSDGTLETCSNTNLPPSANPDESGLEWQAICGIMGLSCKTIAWILGLALTIVPAVLVGARAPKVGPWVALAGFCVSCLIGWFPDWFLLFAVLILAAMGVRRFSGVFG